jgi:hypothetical protein
MRRLALVVALLVAVPALAQAQQPGQTPPLGARQVARDGVGLVERDTVQIAPARGVEIKELVVDNRLGDVQVVGHDGPEVALTVIKRAPDGTTLDRLKVNLSTDINGRVDIGAALLAGVEDRPVPARAVRIDIVVEVPRRAHVTVRAWNGKVAVAGVHAGATLSAHVGDLTVTDVRGKVITDSLRGTQRLSSVSGAVDADTTYGEVAIDGMTGTELAARVQDGQLVASRVKARKVRLRTTFGDIQFSGEILAGADVDIASYQGTVDVRLLPGTTPIRLDAGTREGRLDSRVQLAGGVQPDGNHVQGMLGRGKQPATLRITSVTGNVSVGMAGVQ